MAISGLATKLSDSNKATKRVSTIASAKPFSGLIGAALTKAVSAALAVAKTADTASAGSADSKSGILINVLPNIEKTQSNYLGSGKKNTASSSDDVYNVLRPVQDYELMSSPTNDARQISQINRFHMQIPSSRISTKGFIFMTRPNMNLFKTTVNKLNTYTADPKSINPDLGRLPVFNYVWNLGQNEFKQDSSPCLGRRIYLSLANFITGAAVYPAGETYRVNTPWLSIITNQSNGYNVSDRELDTVSVSETFHGNKVIYAEPTFKHKIGGTISIDFTDRRDLSLYYTLKLWVEYIQAITTGMASPYRKYICQGILDYAASMYYVVTDETMENVIYWEKLTGVFPLSVPDSIFSTSEGYNDKDLKYSINFAYSMRSVQHEVHLLELNALYGITADNMRFSLGNGFTIGTNARGTANTKISTYLTNTVHANSGFKKKGAGDWNGMLSNIQAFYGKSLKNVKQNDFSRWYTISTKNEKGEFYPNWIPEENIHGIPYVNGPFITLGTSKAFDSSSAAKGGSTNIGQFKLRWV